MPVCSNCETTYAAEYDGCPRCAKVRSSTYAKIRNGVGTIALVMVVWAVLSLIVSCST